MAPTSIITEARLELITMAPTSIITEARLELVTMAPTLIITETLEEVLLKAHIGLTLSPVDKINFSILLKEPRSQFLF